MKLFLRLAFVLLTAFFRRALGPFEESVLTLRVWPNDLDTFGHMNNGRYLTIMDLGRLDLMIRTGLFRMVLKRRWTPLVGSAMIRYRRPLNPFQAYRLRTRIVCWDEKWFFIEQRFERLGELMAAGVVKGLLRGRDGNVPTAEILRSMNLDLTSPQIPDWIEHWLQAERTATGSAGTDQ